MSELKSWVVNYEVEFTVKPNPHTEVIIKTKRTDPSVISREEDIETTSKVLYDNQEETTNKILYEKVHQDINMYNDDDYQEKVSRRLVKTEIKETKDYKEHYKVDQINIIKDDHNDIRDEREIEVRQVDGQE